MSVREEGGAAGHVGHNDAVHFSLLMANEMWRSYKCAAAVLILALFLVTIAKTSLYLH